MKILNVKAAKYITNCSYSKIRCRFLVFHSSKQNNLLYQIQNSNYFSTINSAKIEINVCTSKRVSTILSSYQYTSVSVNQKRNLSFAWLDDIAISQSKWFQSLSESQAVEKSMSLLKYINETLSVPWWLSIILSTVLLRTLVTFPLSIYQQYILAKVENLRIEMAGMVPELKKEIGMAVKMFNWDLRTARMNYNRSFRRIWKELIMRENCHPFKAAILLWAQIPMWVMLSMSLRNMAAMLPSNNVDAQSTFEALSTGGFGWIQNLVEVDHTYILPVAMALCNILIVDINECSRIGERTKRQRYIGYFFKSLSLLLIPIAANVPACVVVYWTSSSLYGVVQNLAVLSPRLRRLCRIPQTPSQLTEAPYRHIFKSISKKYLLTKKNDQT